MFTGNASKYVNSFIERIQNAIAVSKVVSTQNIESAKALKNISSTLSKNASKQLGLVDSVDSLTKDIDDNLNSSQAIMSQSMENIIETGHILNDFVTHLEEVAEIILISDQTQQNIIESTAMLTRHTSEIKNVLQIIDDIAKQTSPCICSSWDLPSICMANAF